MTEPREAIVTWMLTLEDKDRPEHLKNCPDLEVVFDEAYDGTYGCDTGCEYYTINGVMRCPHESYHFDYGDFGEMMDYIEGISSRVWLDETR